MSIPKLVASIALAAAALTAIHAEKRCPGNVPGVPLRQIQGALIVVPITINGSGPFDFLIDSGAQITTVDSQLATQLELQSIGSTGVSGIATSERRSSTQLARMEIRAHRVEDVLAVVEDMAQLHQADPKLRGIVGENFLARFDFLIDYEHRTLCLDQSGAMAASITSTMKGLRLPLAQPYGPDRDLPFTRPLVIATQLAGSHTRTLLRLDSGSNAAVLYASPPQKSVALSNAQILKRVVAGTEQDFAVLPPQPIAVAGRILAQIAFVQPMNSIGAATQPREDGTLPTAIFKRVFVSYTRQFAILEPRD